MQDEVSDQPALEIVNLSHSYADKRALSDLTFSVPAGVIFGLLGPNGGGKTTLFRILSTVIKPTSGTASVCGVDVVRSPAEVRRRIGVVFQTPSLDRNLSIAENLMHQGHLYGVHGKTLRTRIYSALESMGLLPRARERVSKLSGGLQRRAEVAKAMLHDPRILLLDEPSTGLDPVARRDLWHHLKSLCSTRRVSSLLTTHLMEEADKCDLVAVIDAGELVAIGTPDELKAEIGGEVIVLESSVAADLRHLIEERFQLAAIEVERTVRIEVPRDGDPAPKLLVDIAEQCAGMIDGARIGKPTLEDVFVHFTGRQFVETKAG